MSWRAIPGFLFKDFSFPYVSSNVVKPVPAPTEDCKTLCAGTPDCCHWAVRDVRSWEDAKDADSGFSGVGWTVAGKDISTFVEAKWCFSETCTKADLFTVKKDTATAGSPNLEFTKPFDQTDAKVALVNLPGQSGANSFYAFFSLTNKGFYVYDSNGILQKHFPQKTRQDALVTMAKDPDLGTGVSFVTSYSCGLFTKEATVAALSVEALPGDIGSSEKSSCGAGYWSDDASAGSHGISFASLACAVFASVALVFVVLFMTRKTSDLEVSLADE